MDYRVRAGASSQVFDYSIPYSGRFNNDDSAYMSRTPTAGNQKTWTWSGWIKRGNIASNMTFFSSDDGSSSNRTAIGWSGSEQWEVAMISSSQTNAVWATSEVARDVSAWYHFVCALDTTDSTAADRLKFYINGVRITDFALNPAIDLDGDYDMNSAGGVMVVGRRDYNTDRYFDGYLAEVNFIDGQQLTPASFGELDSNSNQWRAKSFSGTYGTNGFYLKFQDGGMITYDRTSEITVTSSFVWVYSSSGNTDGEDLVNGILSNDDDGGGWMPVSGSSVVDRWIKFDFGTGKVNKACQWISINSTGGEGTWKWQGSNDDAAWTDIGGTFTLGGSDGGSNVTYTLGDTLSANTTSYRYYRILGISGTSNTSGRRLAMYFSDSIPGLGNDSSGNGNNYTPTNLTAADQMIDGPKAVNGTGVDGAGGNFCTLNPLDKWGTLTVSEGNLKGVTNANDPRIRATIAIPQTGKWYWEFLAQYSTSIMLGVDDQANADESSWYTNNVTVLYNSGNGYKYNFSTTPFPGGAYGATWTTGDIIGVAFNRDDNEITFYKNNSAQPTLTIGGTVEQRARLIPFLGTGTGGADGGGTFNFGQDSSFAGAKGAQGNMDDNNKGDFYYAPPTGFLTLCTSNLDDPSIALPGKNFNTILFADGAGAKTGVGFQPDLVWLKARSVGGVGDRYKLTDNVRGVTKGISSNSVTSSPWATVAETTDSTGLTAFGADGFTVGADAYYSSTTGTGMVAWNWLGANTTVSNTSGTITSTVSANTAAGFSICGYTGTGSNATFGHGLSVAPEYVMVKNRATTDDWAVYNTGLTSATYWLEMNDEVAEASGSTIWNSTAPTATLVNIGSSNNTNKSGDDHIAYCFHSVEGYSKIATFIGNGDADGPFIYCGFRPAWVLVKEVNGSGDWLVNDSARDGYNGANRDLGIWRYDPSSSGNQFDQLSNGLKVRTTAGNTNADGQRMVVLVFAEYPFKFSNAR